MSIHTVIASRDLPARKPLPVFMARPILQHLLRALECLSRRLVPVQVGCLFGPEGLGASEGVVLDLVLGV